jgi:hypothetical protein
LHRKWSPPKHVKHVNPDRLSSDSILRPYLLSARRRAWSTLRPYLKSWPQWDVSSTALGIPWLAIYSTLVLVNHSIV